MLAFHFKSETKSHRRAIALGLILILAASSFATSPQHNHRNDDRRKVEVRKPVEQTVVITKHKDHRAREVRVTTIPQRRESYHESYRESKFESRFKVRIEAWRDVSFRIGMEREFRYASDNCSQFSDNGRQVTYVRNESGTREHYFRDARMVSYDIQGPNGNYHYFENDEMVSIDDNRFGQKQHVYYRK